MLVLLFVALWFIIRVDLFYVLHCVMLFLCCCFFFFCCFFSVLLALLLPRSGKRELILVLFARLLDLRLFGFVCFLFLLVSGRTAVFDCGTSWTFLLSLLNLSVRVSHTYIQEDCNDMLLILKSANPLLINIQNNNNIRYNDYLSGTKPSLKR